MGGNKETREEKWKEKTAAILQWLKAKHILLQLRKKKKRKREEEFEGFS